jgi:uncharacterized protein (TIGR02271 family)
MRFMHEPTAQSSQHPSDHTEVVIPRYEEVLHVDKRAVETGRVRIIKSVRTEECHVDRPLTTEQVDVQRVAVNQFVHDVPQVRQDGDVLIVPVIEEVLVIEKRLMLKEELRITRRRTVEPHTEVVPVRIEEARVERTPVDRPVDQTARPDA